MHSLDLPNYDQVEQKVHFKNCQCKLYEERELLLPNREIPLSQLIGSVAESSGLNMHQTVDENGDERKEGPKLNSQ